MPAVLASILGSIRGGDGKTGILGLAGEVLGAVTGTVKKKHHRRRRMLTASDRSDISFLTALLGRTNAARVAAARIR